VRGGYLNRVWRLSSRKRPSVRMRLRAPVLLCGRDDRRCRALIVYTQEYFCNERQIECAPTRAYFDFAQRGMAGSGIGGGWPFYGSGWSSRRARDATPRESRGRISRSLAMPPIDDAERMRAFFASEPKAGGG